MFKKKFIGVCNSFQSLMGSAVPKWFMQYLSETRSSIEPTSKRNSIKIESWNGHSFEEIEAHLHAFHMSPAGLLFNSMLSKETGMIMAHQCGCNDCFYEGTITIKLPSIEMIQKDYTDHVQQQKEQLGIAA